MPKIVDYEEQRKKIADTALAVIREGGPRQATVRNIAVRSGLSVGSMRHYFPEQKDLMEYAMELIVNQTTERIRSLSFRHPEETLSLEAAKDRFCQLIAVNRQQKMKWKPGWRFVWKPSTNRRLKT